MEKKSHPKHHARSVNDFGNNDGSFYTENQLVQNSPFVMWALMLIIGVYARQ